MSDDATSVPATLLLPQAEADRSPGFDEGEDAGADAWTDSSTLAIGTSTGRLQITARWRVASTLSVLLFAVLFLLAVAIALYRTSASLAQDSPLRLRLGVASSAHREAVLLAEQLPAVGSVGCHTSVDGERCYTNVLWAMHSGYALHPQWYEGLTASSSFEEFQDALYRLKVHNCPRPCGVAAASTPTADVTADGSISEASSLAEAASGSTISSGGGSPSSCHTALQGEDCYRNVLWAMKNGIFINPGWYAPLSESSSFEDFQVLLQSKGGYGCSRPCKALGSEAVKDTYGRQHSKEEVSCHDAVEGEPCHANVQWAMQEGIVSYPDWFKGLTKSSDFRGFQARLHDAFNTSCARPCAPGEEDENKEKAQAEKKRIGCHTAIGGETCYTKVVWVMQTGIYEHPEWYPGVHKASSFEEVQASLRSDSNASCPTPCACHTALKGEPCYNSVMWAIREGIRAHPDWYPDLTERDRFETLQARLHKDVNATCPKPCKPPLWGFPSLFCFSVFRSSGYELDLVKAQVRRGAGIFACDEFSVVSDKRLVLGHTVAGPVHTLKVPFTGCGQSRDGTAANTLIFMNAWDAIHKDLRFKAHDWTIKVDPDAVLLPERLRKHLAPLNGRTVFVRNCARFSGPDWPMMYGALEAFSGSAASIYTREWRRCKRELPWQAWGEDVFMVNCLTHLGVDSAQDLKLVGDERCSGVDCKDQWKAAFHPFKTATEWMKCWEEAML